MGTINIKYDNIQSLIDGLVLNKLNSKLASIDVAHTNITNIGDILRKIPFHDSSIVENFTEIKFIIHYDDLDSTKSRIPQNVGFDPEDKIADGDWYARKGYEDVIRYGTSQSYYSLGVMYKLHVGRCKLSEYKMVTSARFYKDLVDLSGYRYLVMVTDVRQDRNEYSTIRDFDGLEPRLVLSKQIPRTIRSMLDDNRTILPKMLISKNTGSMVADVTNINGEYHIGTFVGHRNKSDMRLLSAVTMLYLAK